MWPVALKCFKPKRIRKSYNTKSNTCEECLAEATRQYVSFRAESGKTSPLQGAGAGRQVSLIEGCLKAYVLAHLAARIAVIGAAEGQFWQSAEQLRHSLARLGAAEAVLFPDAGAVENDKVLHRRTDGQAVFKSRRIQPTSGALNVYVVRW